MLAATVGLALSSSVAVAEEAASSDLPLGDQSTTAVTADEVTDAERTAQELADMPLTGEYASDVDRRWKEFLESKGRQEGHNPGNVFVVSGTAVVNFDAGRPGWVEARRIAFQVAELRAKVALIRFLGQDFERRRDFQSLAIASFGQGYTEDIAVLTQADRILQKTVDVSEAVLDEFLKQLDPEYDPAQYETGDRRAREMRLQEAFSERIVSTASRLVSGALTYKVIEGQTASGGSEILVGLLWSPNLGRLALEIGDATYVMPKLPAGRNIKDELPSTVGEAIGSFGTHVFTNESGRRALIAWGQAEPTFVSPEHKDRALRAALDRAELNAIAEIASFVGERVTALDKTESDAVSRVYAGLAQSNSAIDISSFQNVQAVSRRVSLAGIAPIFRHIVAHPQTGQDVAIVAVLWSPEGLEAAAIMDDAMTNNAMRTEVTPTQSQQQGGTGKVILESRDSDENAL